MGTVEVENVNKPGRTTPLDADKYHAMRTAILAVTPTELPGMTAAEMVEAVVPLLPETQFPGGQKAGWWHKAVQLDLEAKGLLVRDTRSKPLRWHLP
jgi:hypothetical protein